MFLNSLYNRILYINFNQTKTQTLENMNRRANVQKEYQLQKQLMEHQDDVYQQDLPEADYDDEQWELIDYVANTLNINSKKAAEALEKFDFNQSQTIDYLLKEIEKQQKAKEKKKQQKQQKKIEEMKELKSIKAEESAQSQANKKKSQMSVTSMSQTNRKTSSDEINLAPRRKSSHIVEDYQKDHYNADYPDMYINQAKVQPSKTLNIVVVGHVDSGKSTLVGKLLHMIKQVSKKQIHKNQKQAKQLGKQSFKYAFVTDETEQQRKRGVTIDVGVKKIELKDRTIVFLDSPGHRDFIPNMITGAAQADYAILVIDTTHFESTFISGGQTKQHAYIVKSLGVQTIIVAMNKMDAINWNPEAFQTCRNKLNYYLFSIGFSPENIIYVPISAFYGINIEDSVKKQFKSNQIIYENSLIQIIQNLPLPIRPVLKPLRINITNFYDSPGGKLKGHCISGKIEAGILRKDEKYLILPQDCQCIVKQILNNDQKVKQASVGDNVEILIKLIDQTYFQTIRYGNVLSSLTFSMPVSRRFVMDAMALELEMPILKGASVMIYIGSNKATARITKINCKYDPKTGIVLKKNCKSIHSNDCVQIEVQTDQKVCVQKFSNSKVFGRVIVREKKSTLCVGTVTLIK